MSNPQVAPDSASEMDMESEASSMDGVITKSQLYCRIESLQQENLVLKTEVETLKLKVKALLQENQELRKNSVSIQARAEQEEEYISNTLLKQIQILKKEKESLALNYEQEEEFLTNDLSRKLTHLQQEKQVLEQTLEREQEAQVGKLNRRIQKLENDVKAKQQSLETLRREKIQLENTLEQEQEALVNRLWKKMERLEAEKKSLKDQLDSITTLSKSGNVSNASTATVPKNNDNSGGFKPQQSGSGNMSVSTSPSARSAAVLTESRDTEEMATSVERLREEVRILKQELLTQQKEYPQRMQAMKQEEAALIEENKQLRRHLQREVERRQEMTRHLSESESSLEMDEERQFNDRLRQSAVSRGSSFSSAGNMNSNAVVTRTISPHVLVNSSGQLGVVGSLRLCGECGQRLPGGHVAAATAITPINSSHLLSSGCGSNLSLVSNFSTQAQAGSYSSLSSLSVSAVNNASQLSMSGNDALFLKPSAPSSPASSTTSSSHYQQAASPGPSCIADTTTTTNSAATSQSHASAATKQQQ